MKKRISEMTDQEKNQAIARACPDLFFIFLESGDIGWRRNGHVEDVDPINDLNAMHEAEKIFDENIEDASSLRYRYSGYLYHSCTPDDTQPFRSSASQRATAFLLTIGHEQ